MIIKLKKQWLDHKEDEVIDVADETGKILIQQHYAEQVKAKAKVIEAKK